MTKKGRAKQTQRRELRIQQQQQVQLGHLESQQRKQEIENRIEYHERSFEMLLQDSNTQTDDQLERGRDILRQYETALLHGYLVDVLGLEHAQSLIERQTDPIPTESIPSDVEHSFSIARQLAHSEASIKLLKLPGLTHQEQSEARQAASQCQLFASLLDTSLEKHRV